MKRLISILSSVALLCGLCGCGGAPAGVAVYDAAGGLLGTPNALVGVADTLSDPGYASYVEIILAEAVGALAQAQGISEAQASQTLLSGGYAIHTTFDPTVYTALKAGYRDRAPQGLDFAAAATDYGGRLLATYSVGEENYAAAAHAPHSSFKPLGVYAPALDAGVIDWSTMMTDKPYSTVKNEEGASVSWPRNATGTYSYKPTTLYECIRQSLNTASVHCLHRLGVDASISFLQSSFGIDLDYEQQTMEQKGPDEVIGNIALGSMRRGVTPVDMAGYYQIFGNAGQYVPPYGVAEIRDPAGQTVYVAAPTAKQVIKPTTAYIMNQLLRGVVQGGGTGEGVSAQAIPVAGKTGTGDKGEGNWFVGVTPQYSLSVFHGDCDGGNIADALFGAVLDNLPAHTVTDFPACNGVNKGVFCMESGYLFSSSCTRMYVGYYDRENKPPVCNAH